MENLVKLMMTVLLSVGGIGVVSAATQSGNTAGQDDVVITATPDEAVTNETQNTQNSVSLEEAKQTALNKIAGTIESQSEDQDDYIFVIEKDGYLYQVEIDKKDGEIDDVDRVINDTNAITLEKAKSIALAQVNGTVKKTEIDDDEYKIEIEKDGYLYEIEIDRFLGTVKEIDKEVIKSTSTKITLEEAKNIALKKVNGTIKNTETDDDEYQIEIEKDGYLYEIEVDFTGKIKDIDKEVVRTSLKTITEEKAKAIALNEVKGTVKCIDYDHEDNIYEVEIKVSHKEKYEIEIDAQTGKVVSVEKDD